MSRKKDIPEDHMRMLEREICRMANQLPSSSLRDEVRSAAYLGYVDALNKFDNAFGISFVNYAQIRVRGAICDCLRKCDFLTRKIRKYKKCMGQAEAHLAVKLGSSPNFDEVAKEADITREWAVRSSSVGFDLHPDLDCFPEPSPSGNKEDDLIHALDIKFFEESFEKLVSETLTFRQCVVLFERVFEHRKLASIARDIGVTEARVGQIVKEAIRKLHSAYHGQENEPVNCAA